MMNTMVLKITGAGVAFALIFLSGFWLSNSGKPFNTLVLTFHKFMALGILIVLIVTAYRLHQETGLRAVELGATVVTVLVFAATIIDGGLISADIQTPAIIWRLHQFLPFVTLFSTIATLLLLFNRSTTV